jgi:hypothetical protein
VTPQFIDQTPWYTLTAGSVLDVPLPGRKPGDVLVATYVYHDSDAPDLPPRPLPPPLWNDGPGTGTSFEPLSATAFADVKSRTGLFFHVVRLDGGSVASFTCPSDVTAVNQASSVFAVTISCWRNARLASATSSWIGPFTRVAAQNTAPGQLSSVLTILDNSLAVAIAVANFGSFTDTANPSPGWAKVREAHGAVNRGASSIIYTQTANIGTIANANPATFSFAGTVYGYGVYTFSFLPTVDVVASNPLVAAPERVELDCARDYTVFITAADYRTRLDAVEYGSVRWGRVLDDISSASITVPDHFSAPNCIADFGGLKPWRYGLLIERNGQEVWSGPVVSVGRDTGSLASSGSLTIEAADVLSRYKRRVASRFSQNFINHDAAYVMTQVVASAAHPFDMWEVKVPNVVTGSAVTREIIARDFEMAWDVIRDLLDSAMDAYVMNGVLHVFEPVNGWRYVSVNNETLTLPGPYNSLGELEYGLFTGDAWSQEPGWRVDGMTQANRSFVPGADSGEGGFRKYWTAQDSALHPYDGVLDEVEVDSLYRANESGITGDDSSYQRHANSIVQLRGLAPAVISGGVLAEGAPVDIPNLRPGSLWSMDVFDAGFVQLLQAARLKSFTVNVRVGSDGLTEEISPVLQPLGYQED